MLRILLSLFAIGLLGNVNNAVFAEEQTADIDTSAVTASAEKNVDARKNSKAEKEALNNLVVTEVQPNLNPKEKGEKGEKTNKAEKNDKK